MVNEFGEYPMFASGLKNISMSLLCTLRLAESSVIYSLGCMFSVMPVYENPNGLPFWDIYKSIGTETPAVPDCVHLKFVMVPSAVTLQNPAPPNPAIDGELALL